MSALIPYYKRQENVVRHLAEAIEQIPEDKLMWKPSEHSLPWLPLIDHTATGRRNVVLATCKGEDVEMPGVFYKPENQRKISNEAVAAQWDSWNDLKEYLQAQPEDYAKSMVTFPGGFEMTVERMLWMIFEENVHHRGQAWVYARINGIQPPSIWGSEPAWEK